MAEVRLEGVTRRFGDVTAVDAVDLTVNDREFVSLLGPSGCGKTTIMNMIAGLLQPTAGSIYIDGARVNDLAPKDRGIAMVFQDYALYPHMTAYDNLAFPLKALHLSRGEIDRQIQETAHILNLAELMQRLPRELSGGQRQRVALGRAIVRRPKVFLMDEPLSNLDARLRLAMRAELKRLHQQLQVTVIYVTHDQAEAMTLSNRVAVMNRGRLQQMGSPLELYDRPRNTFVGEFMGNMPINLFGARRRTCADTGQPFVAADAFAFHSPDLAALLNGHAGSGGEGGTAGPLLLGIRSENVAVVDRSEREGEVVARVEIVEQLGSDLYVYCRAGDATILARAAPTAPIRPGDEVGLRFDVSRFRIFDRDTGDLLA